MERPAWERDPWRKRKPDCPGSYRLVQAGHPSCLSMAMKTLSCLWTFSFFILVASRSNQVPSITDSHFIEQYIKVHNDYRRRVDPPAADMQYLRWNADLARIAKEWSVKCKLEHNPCTTKPYQCFEEYEYIGENMWIGGINDFSPKAAVTFWHNESLSYDYDTLSCSRVCGHYTQVVWATSNRIGCAITLCPNLGGASIALFVCNYGPAGNFANKAPYIKGKSCSLCPKGLKCVRRLCKHPHKMTQAKASRRTARNLLILGFILLKVF
ncbi:PREDICTED: GLIPR1-like protein 1 [Dipodomys ordii]|uniref:GLIPR1-like protein 1 n=1 Tax=Dipodomys ordii TaxID=10020 RepID=A0A1S3FD35_DIPOR|nr:PREDICTED: GLIPR1-like protein 1 [Dipodomys ordii]